MRKFSQQDGAYRMAHILSLLKGEDFKFIPGFSFRILPVFFVFGFDFFAEIAFPITFQIRLILVFAKMSDNIIFITLIVEDKNILAECLSEHTC